MKGSSPSPDLARIVSIFHTRLFLLRADYWNEYVPSAQNISDDPSREAFSSMVAIGAQEIPLVLPPFRAWVWAS